ELRAREEAY
nr:Chain C, Synthetic peptide GLU-LEU-ARG-ALA-ARG-GLU-GLU-ALA-TYR [synthetic construct]